MKKSPKVKPLAISILFLPGLIFSQSDSEFEGESGKIEELEEFHVSDVPIEESILPTTRPFNSVYGSGMSIMETPRNVTIISREQLDSIAIYDVRDFAKLTASSYTKSNFGAPTNPYLRSMLADTFVNGMRRGLTSNGNGLPINFNAVESVNIVKGPASSVYGASQYTGGYTDLITKKPYFDKPHGSVSVTIGSYEQLRWTIDYGAPISEKFAFRISYSGEESNSYYELGKKNTQSFYGAVTYKSNQNYRLELNFEYFQADYTENWGINRVTQDLIDNGLYLPGSLSPIGDSDGNGFDDSDRNQDGIVDNNDVRSGNNFVEFGEPVKISRRKRLLAPGDDSFGRQLSAQLVQTLDINDKFTISNNTAFNWIDRDTFSSYHYSEILEDNLSFDNRTELRFSFNLNENIQNSVNAGVHFRWQDVLAMNHFFNEPANAWDLTLAPDTRRLADEAFAGNAIVPGYEGRGILSNRYATPSFNGDTGDTQARRYGLYFQDNIKFGDKFSILAGLRFDFIKADFRDPFFGTEDSASERMDNFNVSPIYLINEKMSAYFTYNFSESADSSTGGGFVPSNGATFTTDAFHRESDLFELGMKFSLMDKTLFMTAAIYSQDFARPEQGGISNRVEAKGFEFEANYQPNRNFFLTFSYSYLSATQESGFTASARPVTSNPFTDNGGNASRAPGPVEVTGAPDHLINTLANYKFDNGLFLTFGFVATSSFNNGYNAPTGAFDGGRLLAPIVPWQYTMDATIGYSTERWEIRLQVFNFTDQENWSPPRATYGNDSIVAELPARAELTFKYLW